MRQNNNKIPKKTRSSFSIKISSDDDNRRAPRPWRAWHTQEKCFQAFTLFIHRIIGSYWKQNKVVHVNWYESIDHYKVNKPSNDEELIRAIARGKGGQIVQRWQNFILLLVFLSVILKLPEITQFFSSFADTVIHQWIQYNLRCPFLFLFLDFEMRSHDQRLQRLSFFIIYSKKKKC
jgi:hypothetical protein